MNMLLVAILLVASVVADAAQLPSTKKSYDGFKVLSIIPKDQEAVKLLRDLMINDVETDFWQEPSYVNKEVHLMLSPAHRPKIEKLLTDAGIEFTYHIDNVQHQVNAEQNWLSKRQNAFDLTNYNTLEDIYEWLQSLVTNCRAGLTCELYSIGNSYEGRPIYIVKISKPDAGRKAYWIDATIHAREWISPATVLQILNNLATSNNADAVRLTEAYDWYILPVMNPDGYSYTWTNERMWRKNRAPNAGSTCFGADLNRNFDFRWGNDGVSFNPCSETFCGSTPASEPETKVVQAELLRLGPSLLASVTVHSYGYMWMFPWGNTVNYAGQTCDLADDHNDMMVVAVEIADAIQATYGTNTWARGNSCVVIYSTTGGTDDYAKGAAGVKYSFCPELRGNSFVIDRSNIVPSFNEIWNGIVAMCDSIPA